PVREYRGFSGTWGVTPFRALVNMAVVAPRFYKRGSIECSRVHSVNAVSSVLEVHAGRTGCVLGITGYDAAVGVPCSPPSPAPSTRSSHSRRSDPIFEDSIGGHGDVTGNDRCSARREDQRLGWRALHSLVEAWGPGSRRGDDRARLQFP